MSQTTPPEESCAKSVKPRRLTTLRAWLFCLVVTEAVMVATFIACTIWLAVRSPTSGPMITEDIRRVFLWRGTLYSMRILAGYLVIGLAMATVSWGLACSWASVRGRPLARWSTVRWALLTLLAAVAYKVVACCVYCPRIIENMFTNPWGIRAIGWVGDVTPVWLLVVVRGVFLAGACVLVVGGLARRVGRMRHGARLAVLALSAVVLISVAGLGLSHALNRHPGPPRHDGRPNILILASDGLQLERLGLYGHTRNTSPNIDRLGRDAVRFTNCYVPMARTLTSWTSILTGTYPHTHGLQYTWPAEPHIMMQLPTLCRELRMKGYGSSVFADWAGSDFGKVDYGFDVKEVAPEAWSLSTWIAQATCQAHPLLVAFGDNWLGHKVYPEMKGMPVNPDPESVTRRTIDALEGYARKRQPFFMIAFYSETHLPYATRYPYYRLFTDPNYHGCHKVSVYVPDPRVVASGDFDPESYFDLEQHRALYDGAVRSFDDQVGTVLQTLKDLNLWDDTIVIISSDHGEDMLEAPHSYGHGHYFFGDDYDSRIPLVISDPELRGTAQAGRSIDETRSSIDLMPTLLERVGLPVPATCEGESLMSLIRGERDERDSTIFAETGVLMCGGRALRGSDCLMYPPLMDMFEVTDIDTGQVGIRNEYRDLLIEARHRMLRTSRWKLVYMPLIKGAAYTLYDIQQDRQCLHDVQADFPKVFEELKRGLWQWMELDHRRHREDDHLVANDRAETQ